MTIYRSLVTPGKPLLLDEDVDFRDFDFGKDYPLLGIHDAHIQGIVEKNADILTVNATISGVLVLSDSYDLKPFDYPVKEKDVIPLLSDIEQDMDGYYFPENAIELRDIVYSFLRSFLPIQPLRPGSKPPHYEEEAVEEKGSSPFDVLEGLLEEK